jgi:glycosyltransferase involved in cell wall biosynthesis
MPELLGDAGLYFDPERPDEIAHALRRLLGDPELRGKLAAAAFQRSAAFSWDRCARETFGFLGELVT